MVSSTIKAVEFCILQCIDSRKLVVVTLQYTQFRIVRNIQQIQLIESTTQAYEEAKNRL